MAVSTEKASELLSPTFEAISADAATALRMLDLSTHADVLDVGTGEANFAIYLALEGFDVITGEPANDESHYASRNWEQSAEKVGVRERIRFEAFDGSNMPFSNSAFDAVFFFGVLHHVDEALRNDVFREALRVTKATGAVVFFEPKPDTLKMVWQSDPTHPRAADPSNYAPDEAILESKTVGSLMDIYLYRKRTSSSASGGDS